ncbi:HAD family hydrolase [Desulfurococcus amylolyticus]|uniref:Haloacid dehalogenase domain protein hydrolase n=1 Tax=Desulfurococcus amylolyticus DSM 16532 TaxID=768672 RepID=I3XSI6_DESAM|nr:HAD family hydrolase [Desulfurococcus amylolyticus]AFL66910.1 Haloacid dehalogenase domain protein hydrolase [Desulfurococcus amylolyticus DSM 16532]
MVDALVFDYDGTLSPIDMPRERAFIPPDLNRVLEGLGERYVLGVATSKDYWFIRDRAAWAKVLGLVSGLEAIVGDSYFLAREAMASDRIRLLDELLHEYKWGGCVFVEEKRSVLKLLLGLSVDYRMCSHKPEEVELFAKKAGERGLIVFRYHGQPFIDIYVSKPDKSRVLEIARRLLGLRRIYYFGDSENDIGAFEKADVRILVLHKYNQHMLKYFNYDYIIRFEDLARWLSLEFQH